MDHFQSLTIFTAVADEEGFAAAARSLGLSPPVVTRAVQSLEDRLGARLFDRTTRSVSLTETGRGYYTDCQRILGDLAEADRRAAGLHSIPQGRVTVTASSLFGRKIVTPALLGLLDVYPDISISTLFVDRVVHLQDEGLDVAVRIAQLPESSLMAVRVGAVRRVLVASPDYLDRMGRPQTPDDLAAHDLIHFSSSMDTAGWPLQRNGKSVLVKVAARLHTNTADVAIAAACAGCGITRVLSYQAADEVAAGLLEPVLGNYNPPDVPVDVVHKEAHHVSARVRAVVDHLVGELRGLPVLN